MVLGSFSRFTVLSGTGWILDFGVTLTLVQAGASVFASNAVGAFCGVTFVLIPATRQVFSRVRRWRMPVLIGIYWAWQLHQGHPGRGVAELDATTA